MKSVEKQVVPADSEHGAAEQLKTRWRTTTPYLLSIVFSVVISSYANYLKGRIDPDGFDMWGQTPGIYLPFFAFPVTLLLWLACNWWAPRSPWLMVFLGGLTLSWFVHLVLMRTHGDLYPHTIWLFPIILLLLAWKPPNAETTWLALRVGAWTLLILMALTLTLEKLGLIEQFFTGTQELFEFENANYWLPLKDLFGLEGRWPGPFGHMSKTAFMSAIIIVIALADRGWQRWILLSGGVIGLLLTGGRGGYLALMAGIAVLIIFTNRGLLGRIPLFIRVTIGTFTAIAVSLVLYSMGSLGLTGRQPLWDGFLDLWRDSIWIGVGQTGITQSPQIVEWMEPSWMDAHSLYVEEITKYGIVGSLVIFLTLAIGAVIALRSAWLGSPLPAAIYAVYLTAGITDFLHDGWEVHSTPFLLLILATLFSADRSREATQ
jgi:hypothetical protein